MPTIIRRTTTRSEVITLIGPDYAITIEVSIRGREVDATTLERALHMPLPLLAGLDRETL